MRDGELVAEIPHSQISQDAIISAMAEVNGDAHADGETQSV
jgi:ABC-type sugar transport system ATPase subunit